MQIVNVSLFEGEKMNFNVIDSLLDVLSEQIIIAHKNGAYDNESYIDAVNLVMTLSNINMDLEDKYNDCIDDMIRELNESKYTTLLD